ncbi:Uncharacterised protein [Streptococcus pneumoniae]|nr:Uncharacterised protein [Streptococcus pneumoniae]CJM10969.1 Uncharacterised protein [Streptococcus pneumoniae]CJN63021.1 Uncharacterised protein [Streptococcus pneumoniae]CJS24953.1 Uncharacterised protein [Streptococcus pneumoniae]CJU45756.1 Uncharacterised protein [Streptococcus pneumoniae]
MKLIHDLDTHTTHSTAKMLYNMKAIKNDFSIRRLFQPEPRNLKAKLFSQVIVRAKHIHSNDFDATSDNSIVAKKVISNDSMCSSLKNSDDIELFKILRNKAHLHLPIETVTPRTVSTSQDIILGRFLKLHSKWKSLSFRMTVEVEMES